MEELCKNVLDILLGVPDDEMRYSSDIKVPSELGKPTHKPKPFPPHCLSDKTIYELLEYASAVFRQEPNMLHVQEPVYIIGDIHGQFVDLKRAFAKIGFLSFLQGEKSTFVLEHHKFLFLGDYVDRGPRSVETLCLLFALKLLYPNTFFLLRGNHECAYVNRIYGFSAELERRYSLKLWRSFTTVFNWMPFSALVGERIFCCHGGISPNLTTDGASLVALNSVRRPLEVPAKGLLCDLLWADPDETVADFAPNSRGASFVFGKQPLQKFLDRNELDLVARGHQVVEGGFEFFAQKQLVTIFSAPNYCGFFENEGAFVSVDAELVCRFITLPRTNKDVTVSL